ncbi:MAG: hypothetical protein ACR2MT_18020 [Aurantibacter sp.]
MITFFSVLLVLIAVNAVLMIFSLNGVNPKGKKIDKDAINEALSETYRVNFTSSKYKKAV